MSADMMLLSSLVIVALAQVPAGWESLQLQCIELRLDQKYDESVALLEAYRQKWPKFDGVYGELGRVHAEAGRAIAPRSAASRAERHRHLEAAVRSYERVLELSPEPPRAAQLELADLNGPFELDRPADYERYSRRLVEKNPAVLMFQTRLATLLADSGRLTEAAGVLHDARAVTPEQYPSNARGALALHMTSLVRSNPSLPLPTVRQLVDDALAISEEESARNPKDPDMELVRAGCLTVKAERLESARARQAALRSAAAAAMARYEQMLKAPR